MTSDNIISLLKEKYAKLYFTEIKNDDMKFEPENDDGFIEYKRTLINRSVLKIEQYATQMRWRITQNLKDQIAIYYIGVDDDGTIVGLNNNDIIESIANIILITKSIGASIVCIQFIHIKEKIIVQIRVKIKKISENYLIEFEQGGT